MSPPRVASQRSGSREEIRDYREAKGKSVPHEDMFAPTMSPEQIRGRSEFLQEAESPLDRGIRTADVGSLKLFDAQGVLPSSSASGKDSVVLADTLDGKGLIKSLEHFVGATEAGDAPATRRSFELSSQTYSSLATDSALLTPSREVPTLEIAQHEAEKTTAALAEQGFPVVTRDLQDGRLLLTGFNPKSGETKEIEINFSCGPALRRISDFFQTHEGKPVDGDVVQAIQNVQGVLPQLRAYEDNLKAGKTPTESENKDFLEIVDVIRKADRTIQDTLAVAYFQENPVNKDEAPPPQPDIIEDTVAKVLDFVGIKHPSLPAKRGTEPKVGMDEKTPDEGMAALRKPINMRPTDLTAPERGPISLDESLTRLTMGELSFESKDATLVFGYDALGIDILSRHLETPQTVHSLGYGFAMELANKTADGMREMGFTNVRIGPTEDADTISVSGRNPSTHMPDEIQIDFPKDLQQSQPSEERLQRIEAFDAGWKNRELFPQVDNMIQIAREAGGVVKDFEDRLASGEAKRDRDDPEYINYLKARDFVAITAEAIPYF